MMTTMTKGYGFENFLRRMAKDGFRSYKENPDPFINSYVDYENDELVVESGANLEALRMYEMAQMKCLIAEAILALAYMNIHCKPGFEAFARDFLNLLSKLANDVRGIPNEE
ncbi:hypothetical protein L1987_18924 [Smallanthus sonchifolius]|uniref:Uncharacterized protein n=1 Tax=Smallanthus sonchifolius TaxID=185202 RepID=A0ACB9J237_9ASTR|nr:hypothetical protein L1987_18924 [Smallanthus sonchifolius]